jgi:hypothetical protein
VRRRAISKAEAVRLFRQGMTVPEVCQALGLPLTGSTRKLMREIRPRDIPVRRGRRQRPRVAKAPAVKVGKCPRRTYVDPEVARLRDALVNNWPQHSGELTFLLQEALKRVDPRETVVSYTRHSRTPKLRSIID